MIHRALSLVSFLSTLTGLTILFAPRMPAQSGSNLPNQIRDSVEAWRSRNHQPTGLVVGVYRRDRIIFSQGVGTTRLGSTDSVTTRTIFHVASVTKPFVAMAVMQLADRGEG